MTLCHAIQLIVIDFSTSWTSAVKSEHSVQILCFPQFSGGKWMSSKRKSGRSRKWTIRQKYTAQGEVDGLLTRRRRIWGKVDGLSPESGRSFVVQTCESLSSEFLCKWLLLWHSIYSLISSLYLVIQNRIKNGGYHKIKFVFFRVANEFCFMITLLVTKGPRLINLHMKHWK